MITAAVIKALVIALIALAFVMPDYTPPRGVGLTAFSIVNFVFPLAELVTASAAVAVYAVFSLGAMGTNWIINKFRGSG